MNTILFSVSCYFLWNSLHHSQMSLNIYQTPLSHIPKDNVLRSYSRQYFKYHIVCSSFNCTVSSLNSILSIEWMLVKGELARILKEAIVT